MLIETEERAIRLAKAIIGDIVLYNEAKIREGVGLAAEIEEARQLFISRVQPEMRPLFEAALMASPLAACAFQAEAPPPSFVQPPFEHPPVPRVERERSSSGTVLVIAAIVLVLAAGAAVFLMQSP